MVLLYHKKTIKYIFLSNLQAEIACETVIFANVGRDVVLYCKKCGNAVEEGDRFCENCMFRLDILGNIVTLQEKIHDKQDGEFNPELLNTRDRFLGVKVMGYRIIEELNRNFEQRAFVAVQDGVEKRLHYFEFPSQALYNRLLKEHSFNTERANQFITTAINNYEELLKSHLASFETTGETSLLERYEIIYSPRQGQYHIFLMTPPAKQIWQIFEEREVSVRECIQLSIDYSEKIAQWHRLNLAVQTLSDDSLFITEDPKTGVLTPHIGFPDVGTLHAVAGLPSEVTRYREYFQEIEHTKGVSNDIYRSALLLYKLLNNFRFPFTNFHGSDAMTAVEVLEQAEEQRLAGVTPQPPFFANNAAGRAIVKGIMPKEQRFKTIDEFKRILENALNYLPSQELDRVALAAESVQNNTTLSARNQLESKEFEEILPQKKQNQFVQPSRAQEQEDTSKGKNKGLMIALVIVICLAVALGLLYLNESKRNQSIQPNQPSLSAGISDSLQEFSLEGKHANNFN